MTHCLLLRLEKEITVQHSFNIGNPRGTITILGLAEKVIQLGDCCSKIIHVPKDYADVDLRIPNIDKARELLGFEPKIDLNEEISRTIEWYKWAVKK
jgi:nucleoside-diphosphate-sugar epimerase